MRKNITFCRGDQITFISRPETASVQISFYVSIPIGAAIELQLEDIIQLREILDDTTQYVRYPEMVKRG